MLTVSDIAAFLEQFAPPAIAEEWDNVGLLVGDRQHEVTRVMTCLTITPDSAAEAIAERAELIVTHHPLPFRPLKRLTADTHEGRLLLDLIAAGVAIYSPHTAFDSTRDGINQQLATGLELRDIEPLHEITVESMVAGAGRQGRLAAPLTVEALAARAKQFLSIDQVQIVGAAGQMVARPAIACGSGGDFLEVARARNCDCLITGEARFHTCLEAEAAGIALILVGHYASERFALETLADVLGQRFPELTVWPSRSERDPLRWA